MKRFAVMIMFAAWLLYGAMPAMTMPAAAPMPQPSVEAAHDHTQHDGMTANTDRAQADHTSHAHGDAEKPCPHGSGNGCVAPFCAACLMLLPEISFAETDRFIHPTPEPEDASSLIPSAARPPVPPPRA
jgi:hypothetical protein